MSEKTSNPTPEEVQKEFEDFVKKKFGDQVHVVTQHVHQEDTPFERTSDDNSETATPEPAKKFDKNFRHKPKDVKAHLDRYVIKQDEAKKALAIAVCDHYNHVRQCFEDPDNAPSEYAKQNVMILGPTGVGKTYLIKQIAKLIGVPFVKADATRFSETGYVGSNVDDLVHDLVGQANGDVDLAQYGIIYLDEADKLASSGGARGGKDVSGRGVQFGLLKLMEETEVDLRAGNDMRAQMQAFMDFQRKGKVDPKVVNTKHILFIISGAFTGLEEIIKERLNQNQIGFASQTEALSEDQNILRKAQTQDLIEFGFEPEFVGRLPIRVSCVHLEVDDLFDILKNSEGSLVNQYKRAFSAYGIDVEFTDGALHQIAAMAATQKTGARALMTVCEQALRNFKFELPSVNLKHFVVDESVVTNPELALKRILATAAEIKRHPLSDQVEAYARHFKERHEMILVFNQEAINLICSKAEAADQKADDYCSYLLQSYEHGLKLVEQNTGQSRFQIDKEVIENPRRTLERWIKDSYAAKQDD